LPDIPEDAPERADLLGELGNFYIRVGDFQRALAAYDRALVALPEDARGTMINRLGPVYDRFHPTGRSHLEQFR
jgi:Flp pilus assembly protein TadD